MWLRGRQGAPGGPAAAMFEFSLQRAPRPPQVFVMSGAGTMLAGGALKLQSNACVVLDGSCRDVTLRDVAVTGAHSRPLSDTARVLSLELTGILNDRMTATIVHCELGVLDTESTEHLVHLLALFLASHSGCLSHRNFFRVIPRCVLQTAVRY